jgi:hypothetical protein
LLLRIEPPSLHASGEKALFERRHVGFYSSVNS